MERLLSREIQKYKHEIGISDDSGCTALMYLCNHSSLYLESIYELKDEIMNELKVFILDFFSALFLKAHYIS